MPISSALGSSALLPAGLGFRNVLINGEFRINQRAFTSTTSDGAYGFDRWRMFASDGTTTYSAQTFTVGNVIPNQEPKNFARLVTSGQTSSTAVSILVQRIEDVRTSAGQQVTVSFWAKAASGTPKVSVEFVQGFGSGGSADVNTYINQVTLSTSWVRYTVTGVPPSISGKTIGSDNGYLALHLWVSGGSTYNSRTGSLGIQSNTFDFWGVQLEQNYQPTPFEQRPIGVELALCQRYYALLASGVNSHIGTGAYGTNTQIEIQTSVPVPMRTTPTIAVVTGTNYYVCYGLNFAADYVNSMAVDVHSADNRWILLYNNSEVSATAGNPAWLRGNDAAARIAFSAEL
jgi:hypothetical protein